MLCKQHTSQGQRQYSHCVCQAHKVRVSRDFLRQGPQSQRETVAFVSVKAHKVNDCCSCLRQGPQGQRVLSLFLSRPTTSESVVAVSVKAHKVRDCCHCLCQGPQGQRLLSLSPSRPTRSAQRLLPLSTRSETVVTVSFKAHKVRDCCSCLRQGPQGQRLL